MIHAEAGAVTAGEVDHLGNARMVLTDEQQQDVYPAVTLEGDLNNSSDAAYIEKNYYNIDAANVVNKSVATGITDYQNNNGNPPPNNNPNSNTTANSAKLYKLAATAASNGGKTGLGITLKVTGGDKIDIFGKSYYFQNNTGGNNYDVPVLGILDGFIGTPGSPAGGKTTVTELNGIGVITGAVSSFLTNTDRNNGGTGTTPKAYINYILFDEQFRYVTGGFSRVGDNGSVKSHYSDASMQDINVEKNGYIYVYVSNESPTDVFFDNLQVIHTRGPILEETHYYPFGLTMAGISSKALKMNYAENKFKFGDKELQSEEFSDGTGLEEYDFGARFYDPQLGRWHTIDPLSEVSHRWSPYNYAYNNPLRFIDPDGMLSYDREKRKEWGLNPDSRHHGEDGNSIFFHTDFHTWSHGGSGDPKPKEVRHSKKVNHDFAKVDNEWVPAQNLEPVTVTAGVKRDGYDDEMGSVISAAIPIAGALSASDGPVPIDDALGSLVFATAVTYDITQRTWITYTTIHPLTGQIYAGRASGYGTPEQVLARRWYRHLILRGLGFSYPILDQSTQGPLGYPATRGREQQLYDRARLSGQQVANLIRPVSPYNPAAPFYHVTSNIVFREQIAPYTGHNPIKFGF